MTAIERLCLVTGMSGAGKSAALAILEDLGYEVIDNLPVRLVDGVLSGAAESARGLAVGIDARTRDFRSETVLSTVEALRARGRPSLSLLFLDCDDAVLQRRFTETRRRHPMARDRPPADGIRRERLLMAPVKARADSVLDTSLLGLPDLRRLLGGRYAASPAALRVFVSSFGFRRGVPREADFVFDVRFLRNPHYDPRLSALGGHDPAVAAFVSEDPAFAGFVDRLAALLAPLMPRYAEEGRPYLTLAIGCTGGRHRSVVVAERLAERLRRNGAVEVAVHHRDIDFARPPA